MTVHTALRTRSPTAGYRDATVLRDLDIDISAGRETATMPGARTHSTRLWLAALPGALLLAGADLAARTLLAPREIPAGVLTALTGAPYMLALLVIETRRGRTRGRGR
jgi:hypothetical protein